MTTGDFLDLPSPEHRTGKENHQDADRCVGFELTFPDPRSSPVTSGVMASPPVWAQLRRYEGFDGLLISRLPIVQQKLMIVYEDPRIIDHQLYHGGVQQSRKSAYLPAYTAGDEHEQRIKGKSNLGAGR